MNKNDITLESAIELLKDFVNLTDVPDQNCSCHINPPCSDCVDYLAVREALSKARDMIESFQKE